MTRADSGQSGPIRSILDRLRLYATLVVFALVCLTWTVVALPLYLAIPKGEGTAIGRRGISRGFWLFTWWLRGAGVYRLDLSAIDALRGSGPLILTCNHPTIIDAILIVTRHPNIVCIMKSAILNNLLLGAGARLAGYICNDPPRRMVRAAVAELDRGALVLLFPEATRTTVAPVNPFIASVGLIAKLAQVPVQTLLVDVDRPYMSKRHGFVRPVRLPIRYRVRLGERFEPPEDARSFDRVLEDYYRIELADSSQRRWLGEGQQAPTG